MFEPKTLPKIHEAETVGFPDHVPYAKRYPLGRRPITKSEGLLLEQDR